MSEDRIKKSQIKYFENINEALNMQQLANMIQFGDSVVIDEKSLMEREFEADEVVVNSIGKFDCDTQVTLEKFEQYKKVLQSIYFEIGVQVGISLQTELFSEYVTK